MQQKNLSQLEQELMDIVWKLKKSSVREVVENLKPKKKLAYTTVATILQRLSEKGLVKKTNGDSVLYYTPKLTKEMYSKNIVKSFINNFTTHFGDTAMVSFAESIDKLPKDKKEFLLKLLKKTK